MFCILQICYYMNFLYNEIILLQLPNNWIFHNYIIFETIKKILDFYSMTSFVDITWNLSKYYN